MPLIAAKTIIVSISLFHITLAFFFLTSPRTVSDQVLVYVMGESMGMVCLSPTPKSDCQEELGANKTPLVQPVSRGFDTQSPALAFLAVVLAMFGFSDLVSLSMPEEVGSLYYWGTQGSFPFPLLTPPNH